MFAPVGRPVVVWPAPEGAPARGAPRGGDGCRFCKRCSGVTRFDSLEPTGALGVWPHSCEPGGTVDARGPRRRSRWPPPASAVSLSRRLASWLPSAAPATRPRPRPHSRPSPAPWGCTSGGPVLMETCGLARRSSRQAANLCAPVVAAVCQSTPLVARIDARQRRSGANVSPRRRGARERGEPFRRKHCSDRRGPEGARPRGGSRSDLTRPTVSECTFGSLHTEDEREGFGVRRCADSGSVSRSAVVDLWWSSGRSVENGPLESHSRRRLPLERER